MFDHVKSTRIDFVKKFLLPLLIILFVGGFLVRLYRINNPIADWHSFRQSDTNAVSAIYVRDGIDLLHPRYFDISNIQSGKDNPQGYRMVEFPIYNAVQASIYKLFSWASLSLPEVGRLMSILATLGGAFVVYLLVKKYADEISAFFATFFYLFIPFSIYYGRTILPDPSMAAAILAGIYFFDRWISEEKKDKLRVLSFNFLLAIFFTALSFLLKPYSLFFTLPMLWIVFKKFGFKLFKQWALYLFASFCLIPLVLWRKWIGNFPEGIPGSLWLLNGNGIRFHPAFFRWIFYERITRLILGFVGVAFLIPGIYRAVRELKKNGGFFLSFGVSSLVYVTVIATGNVQHDYYQILIIPTISIFAGIGAGFLWKLLHKNTFLQYQIIVLAILTVLIGWIGVKDYFNINDWGMVAAGIEANKVLPKNAKVIAPYDGSTVLLNIMQRPGWPAFEHGFDELISMGANYMVLPNPSKSDVEQYSKKYEVIESAPNYLIVRLK